MRNTLIVLITACLWAPGCPGGQPPSSDALNRYLERGGHGPVAADAPAPAAPVARRVAITVVSGHELPDMDTGPGVTDPYVILEYEGQRFESSVVEGSLEPVWGDSVVFDIKPGGVLRVSLMDEDALASDDKLGVVSQMLPDVRVGEQHELMLSFRNGEMGRVKLTLVGMRTP